MGDVIDLGAERWKRRGQGHAGRQARVGNPGESRLERAIAASVPTSFPMLPGGAPQPVLERSLPDGWEPSTTLEAPGDECPDCGRTSWCACGLPDPCDDDAPAGDVRRTNEGDLRARGPWTDRLSPAETITHAICTNLPDPDAEPARLTWAVWTRAVLRAKRGDL